MDMDALCQLAVDALEVPQVASLPESDDAKQQLVSACELACGGSCPSAAEQDRTHDQYYLTSKKAKLITSPQKMMPSMLILLVIFIIQKLF